MRRAREGVSAGEDGEEYKSMRRMGARGGEEKQEVVRVRKKKRSKCLVLLVHEDEEGNVL